MGKSIENRMLADALHRLGHLDQLRQLAFGLGQPMTWEPPLDLIETATELVAYVVLPGVDPATVEIEVAGGTLTLRGLRARPSELGATSILRLELPWGRFERRVTIPDAPYRVSRETAPGCLVVRLAKLAEAKQ
ncbi:Hsp20/alpha crystallin family protein [Yangia mangrovi]|uniref:Heat-shock protein Hsp20 n=1 Tax=Alloyangia mangrovi TaxID=1779329 RepID=A0A2A3JWG6_9RHOB|nr:Hsp20/alpha crystallin family protein [Alloyangia mangrovi]MCA0942103.1 Hsp20/alpha crystallin family protein [Alloyangia pacifica]MCA0947132.1 Hsp20/alpha crystallin family protein [Alloyangia pacifica]MCT4371090.1 Hsp20/alpha crystallin family protein [Alloyangia mangrovi]